MHVQSYIPTFCAIHNTLIVSVKCWGCHWCDRMAVVFTTTCAISAYDH